MQKITTEFLKSLNARQNNIDIVASYPDKDAVAVIRRLVADGHSDYAIWLLPRLIKKQEQIKYIIFVAELALPIWESEYPKDKKPRAALAAVKRYVDDPTHNNINVAKMWAVAMLVAWTKKTKEIQTEIIEYGISLLK